MRINLNVDASYKVYCISINSIDILCHKLFFYRFILKDIDLRLKYSPKHRKIKRCFPSLKAVEFDAVAFSHLRVSRRPLPET